ncbi:MAG: zinc ribbon domain-containing protein, partial [Anaerolineales bacterium]
GCGGWVEKTLAIRVHHCPACGLVLDRDVNAARNILHLALGTGYSYRPDGAGRA